MSAAISRRASRPIFQTLSLRAAAVVAIIHFIIHPTGLATGRAKEVKIF
jgi:hypothetical protein